MQGKEAKGDGKSSVELKSDAQGTASVVIVPPGDVSFFVIKRDTKIGVRAKNKKAESYVNFKGASADTVDLIAMSRSRM